MCHLQQGGGKVVVKLNRNSFAFPMILLLLAAVTRCINGQAHPRNKIFVYCG